MIPRAATRGRVEAGRRLVEEDQLGIADEREREIEPTLLTARQRLHARAGLLGEPDEVEQLVDRTRRRVRAAGVQHVLATP